MKGQVFRSHGSEYFIRSGDETYRVVARGKMKGKTEILVGDYVEFKSGAIDSVYPRTSRFIRPSVANVEMIAAVLSALPRPDFLMLDKLLVSAEKEGVDVVFVVNKNDLGKEIYEKVRREYAGTGKEIFSVSAETGENLDTLKDRLKGRLTAFAGQSAVGKTSLVNAMFKTSLKVGDLSSIGRGRHTTTYSNIYFFDAWKIVDTPGFAVLESEIGAGELARYYPEFEAHLNECRFRGCTHTGEKGCAIASLAESGEIARERYERYQEIYRQLKEKKKYE